MNLKNLIENYRVPVSFEKDYKIDNNIIIKILEAARWAPSAENQQAWRFLVVDKNRKKKDILYAIEEQDSRLSSTLHEIKKPKLSPSFQYTIDNYNAKSAKYLEEIRIKNSEELKCAHSASLFIICVHSEKFYGKMFGYTDIGASIMNMLLITEELGLSTRWIRNFSRNIIMDKFDIPSHFKIDAILAIGKKKGSLEKTELSRKNFNDYFYQNNWQNPLEDSLLKIENDDLPNYDVEIVDSILDRRSIRDYKENKIISQNLIKELIKAAMMVPLTINKPNIKLLIIDDPEKLNEIAKNSKIIVKQSHVQEVPLIIAAVFDCSNNAPAFYAETDTGAILQNILLRAFSLGIGSCWIGAFSRKATSNILETPSSWHLPSLAIFGYPDHYPSPTPRKDLGKIAYKNSWKNRLEKRKRSLFPNYHIFSVFTRKIKNTNVETPLRERNVGEIENIPEFEENSNI
jgi:nitroreductase